MSLHCASGRSSRLAAVLAVLSIGALGCGADPQTDVRSPDGELGSNSSALFQEGTRWPASQGITTVRVCFRSAPGFSADVWAQRREQVRDALADTWQRWTKLVFTGFDICSAAPSGNAIVIDLDPTPSGGAGVSGIGYQGANANVYVTLRLEGIGEDLLRTVSAHEIGHSLGFSHEHYRPDAWVNGVALCSDHPELHNGGTLLTSYYDDGSIMSYCNPRARNSLSIGDIEGAQRLYGIGSAGLWLRAQPSLALFSL